MKQMAVGNTFSIPNPLIIMVVLGVIFFLLLHKSVFGRYLFASGYNEESARYAGINSKRIITTSYVICGLTTAFSAILFGFFANSISPSMHGNFYELYAIAAAVLGGCSLRGGEGSIIGVVLGITLLLFLRNLVTILHIDSSLEFAVMGVVIFIGVLADTLLRKKA
jgi:ribose transport system permease protein